MIRLSKMLVGSQTRMVLQVHDEIVLEAPIAEASASADILRECMVNPLPNGVLRVPLAIKLFAELHSTDFSRFPHPFSAHSASLWELLGQAST
jgi:hypothetical protein